MQLPVYELKINEHADSFVEAIALVEEPAIESDFLAFNKTNQFNFSSDDKMELIGGAMIPDMKIYRRDADGTEYNVFFSKETIRQIAQVFFKKGFQSNLNLDHTTTPANSYIFQSYIVDQEKGMTSPKGLNLPDGSWVVGVKVQDQNIWNDIKAGKQKGFSVEGLFQYFQKEDEDAQILEALHQLNNLLQKKHNTL
jgi:hypothetical protein